MSFHRIKLIFYSRYYSRPIQPHFRKIFRTEPKTEPPDIFKFWDFQKLKWIFSFLNDFRHLQNSIARLRFGAPKFLEFKNMNSQYSPEQKIRVIAAIENFLTFREYTCCTEFQFGNSFRAPKLKVPYHFFENLR